MLHKRQIGGFSASYVLRSNPGNVIYHFRLNEKQLILTFGKDKRMKSKTTRLIWILALLAGLSAACNQTGEQKARSGGEEIWFEEILHDYGEIPVGSDGTWSFVFKNLGKESILVNRVRSTCGCTVPAWPREPIAPGDTGKITVKYNTAQTGTFLKSVLVYSTAANSPVKLQIKGKVFAAG